MNDDLNSHFENELINARHDATSLRLKLERADRKITELEEANTRLVDRNWELQKRLVEQSTWPKA